MKVSPAPVVSTVSNLWALIFNNSSLNEYSDPFSPSVNIISVLLNLLFKTFKIPSGFFSLDNAYPSVWFKIRVEILF